MHTFATILWTFVITAIVTFLATAIFSFQYHEREKEALREAVQRGHELHGKIQEEVQAIVAEGVRAKNTLEAYAKRIYAAVGL